jgi:AcrR family transcriptional regulator
MKNSSQNQESKRPYRSPLRQRQAEETRQRILAEARALLITQGYVGMTMEAIAEAAEVSPKTIAAVVGSKREILAAIVNPDAFDTPVQDLLGKLRTGQDPEQRVKLVVLIIRRVYESLRTEFELLRTAGVVDPELADLARRIEARRRHNQSYLITDLHERGALRNDLPPEEALDILWSLTGYDLYRMLVIECGWEAERYENWLCQLLLDRLLQSAAH